MNRILILLLVAAGGFASVKLLKKEEPPPPPPPVDNSTAMAKGKSLIMTAKHYERLVANPPKRPSPSDRVKLADYQKKAAEARAEAAQLGYSEN